MRMRGFYLVNELATMAEFFKEFTSNRCKAVLVLSSLKTYDDIFFEYFVASAYSGQFWTLFSRLISC